MKTDEAVGGPINHPKHYNDHPSGVECIVIVRHMPFNTGNVFKYLWRAGLKNAAATLEDHKKARWYLDDEIKRLEAEQKAADTGTHQIISELAGLPPVDPRLNWFCFSCCRDNKVGDVCTSCERPQPAVPTDAELRERAKGKIATDHPFHRGGNPKFCHCGLPPEQHR